MKLNNSIKKYTARRVDVSVKRGTAPTKTETMRIIKQSTRVVDNNGKLLAVFIKNALPPWAVEIGRKMKTLRGYSRTRRMYAGSGYKSNIESCPVGFLCPPRFKEIMLTTPTRKRLKFYQDEVKRLYAYIDTYIKKFTPNEYAHQLQIMQDCPRLFKQSSVTTNTQVNFNVTAHYHRDYGNANNMGSVMAFNIDTLTPFSGGEFILGNYDTGFALQEGDILIVDQAKLHGTLPHTGRRLSLVGFISAQLLKADINKTPIRKVYNGIQLVQ